MAEYRITYYDGKIIRFSYKDYAEGGKTSFMTLKVHTFIGRLIRHIPDKHFPMIRYAGLFSNRWKVQYLGQARDALNQADPDDSDEDTQPTWAERQTDYTGIDPLICPNCDKPLTFVGTFFGLRLVEPTPRRETGTNSSIFLISQAKSLPFLPLYCDQDSPCGLGILESWNIGEKQEQSFISFKIHHSTIPSFHYSVSEANLASCGYHSKGSAANVHFVVMHGIFSPRRRLYEPEATTSYFAL
jgi:hypothetical protein